MEEQKVVEKVEKKEYIPVEVIVHKNFDGKLVTASKRYPKTGVVFNCMIGIPRNEEEAQAMYRSSMQEIFERGIIQIGYSESVWSKSPKDKRTGIKEIAEDNNTDVNTQEFQEALAIALEKNLASEKTRESGTNTNKTKIAEMQRAYAEYGLDYKTATIKDLEKAIVAKLTGKKAK